MGVMGWLVIVGWRAEVEGLVSLGCKGDQVSNSRIRSFSSVLVILKVEANQVRSFQRLAFEFHRVGHAKFDIVELISFH